MRQGDVGIDEFPDATAEDERSLALGAKVSYVIDPKNPYPDEYRGHLRVTRNDGTTMEERRPPLRGGHHEPLSRADIEEKFRANCAYGGWPRERAERWLAFARGAFDSPIDPTEVRG